jgi:hypothetical protein
MTPILPINDCPSMRFFPIWFEQKGATSLMVATLNSVRRLSTIATCQETQPQLSPHLLIALDF